MIGEPAAPDSVVHARDVVVLAGWHEFYLLAGTAAVTLVGLLFVAVSFNLDVIIHHTRTHLLAHARESMLSFVYVMLISLMVLVPGSGSRVLGANIAAASLVMLVILARAMIRDRRRGYGEHERFLIRRRRTTMVGYLAAIWAGATMALTRNPYQSYWMIGIVCLLLGNAAGSALDLLVRVGKLKAELQPPSR